MVSRAALNLTEAQAAHRFALIKRIAALLIAALCIWAIVNAMRGQALADIIATIGATPFGVVALAATLVFINYGVMCGMEMLAMRDAGVHASAAKAAASAFVGNALSVAAGLGPISGASVRAALFHRWRLPLYAAPAVAIGVTLMSLAGGASLAALGTVLQPAAVAGVLDAPLALVRGVGVAFLTLVAGAMVVIGRSRMAFSLFGARLSVPSAGGALLRIGLGALDWWISANVFFALLNGTLNWAPLSFVTTFASAHFAGMAVGAPAGIGVFDAIFLQLGAGDIAPAQVAAALLLYRLVSYALPAAFALGPYLALSRDAAPAQ